MSRNKGKRGEREVALLAREHGFPRAERDWRTPQLNGDIRGIRDDLHLEVRYRQGLSVEAWCREVEAKAVDRIPVVAWRRNGQPWRATLPLTDLLNLLATEEEPDASSRVGASVNAANVAGVIGRRGMSEGGQAEEKRYTIVGHAEDCAGALIPSACKCEPIQTTYVPESLITGAIKWAEREAILTAENHEESKRSPYWRMADYLRNRLQGEGDG